MAAMKQRVKNLKGSEYFPYPLYVVPPSGQSFLVITHPLDPSSVQFSTPQPQGQNNKCVRTINVSFHPRETKAHMGGSFTGQSIPGFIELTKGK